LLQILAGRTVAKVADVKLLAQVGLRCMDLAVLW